MVSYLDSLRASNDYSAFDFHESSKWSVIFDGLCVNSLFVVLKGLIRGCRGGIRPRVRCASLLCFYFIGEGWWKRGVCKFSGRN